MKDKEEARVAMEKLNNHNFNGSTISVQVRQFNLMFDFLNSANSQIDFIIAFYFDGQEKQEETKSKEKFQQ